MLKFCILVLSTFIVSNILVSLYRNTLQKALSHKLPANLVLPAAIVLSIAIYAQKEEAVVDIADIKNVEIKSIHMDALEGNVEAIKLHISMGRDLEETEPSGGSTPLITAALFGKTEVVGLLIDAGANVNYQNNDGSTALHSAAFFCHPEIVSLLLKNGVKRELKNNSGATALASVQAPFEVVQDIYLYFANTLGPLGLQIDQGHIKDMRPKIARMLIEYEDK